MKLLMLLEAHIYTALFAYILVEEVGVFLPIPGDAMLIYLGILSRQGEADFWSVLGIVCLATWIGTTFLYSLSRIVGRPFLEKHDRVLRFFHISSKNINQMEHYMQHYGSWIIIVSRLTPGLRIIGTIAAGLLNVSYRTFFISTMLGTVLWTAIYFGIGSLLGKHYADQVEQVFSNKLLMAGLFAIGILIWVALYKLLGPRLGHMPNQHQDA
jgi:membrane protein DedA with SNARE-associated domain